MLLTGIAWGIIGRAYGIGAVPIRKQCLLTGGVGCFADAARVENRTTATTMAFCAAAPIAARARALIAMAITRARTVACTVTGTAAAIAGLRGIGVIIMYAVTLGVFTVIRTIHKNARVGARITLAIATALASTILRTIAMSAAVACVCYGCRSARWFAFQPTITEGFIACAAAAHFTSAAIACAAAGAEGAHTSIAYTA